MTNDYVRCIPCMIGLHSECLDALPTDTDDLIACCCGGLEVSHVSRETSGEVGRPMKDLDAITDIRSTGRKRAAQIAPIFDGMVCEWAGLKFAGGGVEPIMGCVDNTIAMAKSTVEAKRKGADSVGRLHHGPDKNTLENTPGVNLHRICEECHQRWHALNNASYEGTRPEAGKQWYPEGDWIKHDPATMYTDEERDEWLAQHGWK